LASFSLHLHTCNLGTAVREAVNPFTGEVLKIPVDLGPTATEIDAVRDFLTESRAGELDPDTYCRIDLPDGSKVNVAIGTLGQKHPCIAFAVECFALTDDTVSFVLELAKRGRMSIGSTSDPGVVALPAGDLPARVAQRWPSAPVVETPAELWVWLQHNIRQ
jgi:hypothetical protein